MIYSAEERNEVYQRAHGVLSGICRNCGSCCNLDVNIISLHPYEVSRIAYLLKQRGGMPFVRKHIKRISSSFNAIPEYHLYSKERCPFVEKNHCTIYKARPLVCKLYPIFNDAFIDTSDGLRFRKPILGLHRTYERKETPCYRSILELKKIMGIEIRAIHMADYPNLNYLLVFDMLENAEDIAYLFMNPSPHPSEPDFFRPSRMGLSADEFKTEVAHQAWQIWNVPIGSRVSEHLTPVKQSVIRNLSTLDYVRRNRLEAASIVEQNMSQLLSIFE